MFFTQFGLLFSNMEWFVIVCFIMGTAFLLIELFLPGFGFFGISGSAFVVASIVLRAVFHKKEDIVLMQAFQFIIVYVLIFGAALLFLGIAKKKGWLKKTSLFHTGTAVDAAYSDGTVNYGFLVGKDGVSATVLRPSGKAEIDGKIYDVESDGFLIEKGVKIKVTAWGGGTVKVTKAEKCDG